MDRKQLEALLKSKNIRPDAYSLYGGLPNEAYCIDGKNGVWKVYYSERGTAGSTMRFDTEAGACDYFYNWIMSDGSGK
ncbi:hypothetical protein [Mucilaginibacter sp.]|uniref:hypothetical protein n=1 Tax=Mucilaginibacter sp. TaxID=1882438 RepID=UPI0025D136D6|nr:hypothetical protein [Mucilaginibacter sp.]